MEAKQETIEQQQINELKREMRKLSTLVDALCSSNFLTDHQDGDEEFRKWSVDHLNRHNRKTIEEYKAKMEHNKLWNQQREIRDRMMAIEQDYPRLRDPVEVPVSYEAYRYPNQATNVGVPLTAKVTGQTIVSNGGTSWVAK